MTNIITPRSKSNLKPRDIRRVVSHLTSRAAWLERRREADPRCRASQLNDGADCHRLADLLAATIEGGTK
jgi:hypothetical protein